MANLYGKVTGVFATRAEYRPNPIAMTTCKMINVDEGMGFIEVVDIDAFDETPIVDLKAYFPVCDRVKEARIPEWLFDWPEWLPEKGLGLKGIQGKWALQMEIEMGVGHE